MRAATRTIFSKHLARPAMRRSTGAIAIAAAIVSLTWTLGSSFLHAEERERDREFDTENLFVFLTGSDVGETGEKEIEGEMFGRFGKRTGSYVAMSGGLAVQYVPIDNLSLELGGLLAHYNGVAGLDDQQRGGFDGLSFEAKYRVLDRERFGFGLTVGVEPEWRRIDTAGTPVDEYGAALKLFIDKEIVPKRVVAAFNLIYEPEVSRERASGVWSREATLEISGAVSGQIRPGLFVAGEVRYLRSYEGLPLHAFAGHALFVGPAVYAELSDRAWIAAAWSTQIAGSATEVPGSLDLINFERHQAKFRFGIKF